MSETHSRRKYERKGEARLSLVGAGLPHWVEFHCEKFNPMTIGIRAQLIQRAARSHGSYSRTADASGDFDRARR